VGPARENDKLAAEAAEHQQEAESDGPPAAPIRVAARSGEPAVSAAKAQVTDAPIWRLKPILTCNIHRAGDIGTVESKLYGMEAVRVRAVGFDLDFERARVALNAAEVPLDPFFVCGGWCSRSWREAPSPPRIARFDYRKQIGHRDA
jgi:hypothetical protein